MDKNIKEIIINAARSVFAKFGFNKTTMNEIAKGARKAKSSLYHYFSSKEDIFEEVIKRESNVLKTELMKAINSKKTTKEKLKAYVVTRMKIIHDLANFYSALKDEYLDNYSFIEILRKDYFEFEIELMKKLLREGVDGGEFVVNDLDVTSFAIVTALKGLEYPWIAESNFVKTKKNIDSLLDVLFFGLVKR